MRLDVERARTFVRDEPKVAVVALAVMVAGMIATPLFERGGDERRVLASVVVGALFVCAVSASARAHGPRSFLAAGAIVVVTLVVEVVGSSTGFPFGEYDYTGALTPRVSGVPVVVAFAWAGITLTVHGALRDVRLGSRRAGALAHVVTMALAITAWDVFLDPQMVAEGYWRWEPATPSFRGIPLVNYRGWILTGLVTSALAVSSCGPARGPASGVPRLAYAVLAALSTVGFLAFFDDAVVAVAGGSAMGSFVALSYLAKRSRSA